MLGWLKEYLWPTVVVDDKLSESQKLYNEMQIRCPSCHNQMLWMEGPQGGLCINVFCGHCGQGYNITPIIGIAEIIHKDVRYIEK